MFFDNIKDIGCYKDNLERVIFLLEVMSLLLDGSYVQRLVVIRCCVKFVYDMKFDVFVVQNGGQCLGGFDVNLNYKKYGNFIKC